MTKIRWSGSDGVVCVTKWREREGEVLHVLSIDFDYWYLGGLPPRLSHCGFCENYRYTGLVRPPPAVKGEPQRDINYRMIFRRVAVGTPIHVSESHAAIVGLLQELREGNPEAHIVVWNIDEHDDLEPHDNLKPLAFPRYNCGTWVNFSGVKGYLDEYWWVIDRRILLHLPRKPDLIFVCKSSPYLAVAGDRPLITFIRNLEKVSGQEARVYGHASKPIRDALTRRRG
jgi:hypothetical protein